MYKLISQLTLTAIFLSLTFCGIAKDIDFNIDSISIEGDLGEFEVDLKIREIESGLEIITMTMSSSEKITPPKFSLKWRFASSDIYAYWNSNSKVDKVNYYYNSFSSAATGQAPVTTFMSAADQNRFTFAISDGLNKVDFGTELIEEDACFHCELTFFGEYNPPIDSYSVEILVDRRAKPYYDVLSDVSSWWASHEDYKPAVVPDDARKPMYSTWYSYHQILDVDVLLSECAKAKEIGMDAIIVDDGWQTMDSKRGYAYTGDWNPDRIPDMKGFVDGVHNLDMKVLLWYSLPFVGEKADNYERFKGKYLRHWESQSTYVLDPRYPEVREFVIGTYEKALKEWGLDGFKLDFLGWFKPTAETVLTAEDGRDFASVNEATDKLMTDIMSRLNSINPEIMIEFRQPYIGPIMRKYGNMFRAADCPNMAVVNRNRVTDIRLIGGETAVHSDMFMWHQSDPVESAALQILNIIFSVPQLSVRLSEIPQEHLDMVKFWTSYWNRNRATLLDGKFMPVNPQALYPIITAEDENKTISALYNDMVLDIKSEGAIDIINAKSSSSVVVRLLESIGKREVSIFNCKGELVESKSYKFTEGVHQFDLPASGLIEIR